MYFHSETAHAARLAALDHYQLASSILLDSTARLVDLYADANSTALGLARNSESLREPALFKHIVPELFMGHLRIAGHAHQNLVRLVEAQIHTSSALARFTLNKTAQMSPPLLEFAIDAAESIIVAGESVAEKLGDASVKAVVDVDRKMARTAAPKNKSRS